MLSCCGGANSTSPRASVRGLFETLYEASWLPESVLTPTLEKLYGGGLAFEGPRVYANFVSTLDGVVAIPSLAQSNTLISGGSDGDRFVMGLLRAFADVVLTAAGTLAASPRGSWMPDRIYPPAAAAYADLRRSLGKEERPEVAILTGSGAIDPGHPALEAGALVLTSEAGAERLSDRLPKASQLVSLAGERELDPAAVVAKLRERGHELVLCEAGPHGFGSFVRAGVVDELFLTISPLLAGRPRDGERLGLVEGAALLPENGVPARVSSVKRQDAHLFLRYALR